MSRRVVITGIGAVTPIGTGAQGLWDGVVRAESAIRKLSCFDASSFNSLVAGEIPDFRPEDYLDVKRLKRLDRFSRLALVTGILALQDSGLKPTDFDPDRAGATIGSALGGVGCAEQEYIRFMQGGIRAVHSHSASSAVLRPAISRSNSACRAIQRLTPTVALPGRSRWETLFTRSEEAMLM